MKGRAEGQLEEEREREQRGAEKDLFEGRG